MQGRRYRLALPPKPRRHDIQLARLLPAGRRLGMPHHPEAALQALEHPPLRPALEQLADEPATLGQDRLGDLQRQLRQRHDADVIGRRMSGGIRRHVGQHEVGLAAQQLQQRRLTRWVHDVALDQRRARDRFDRQQVDSHHARRAALQRHLSPTPGRRPQIQHQPTLADQMIALVQLDQLERGPRAPTLALRRLHIGVVQLPPQPTLLRRAAPARGAQHNRRIAPAQRLHTHGFTPEQNHAPDPLRHPRWAAAPSAVSNEAAGGRHASDATACPRAGPDPPPPRAAPATAG